MKQLRIVKGTTNAKVYMNEGTPRPVFWTLEKFGDRQLRQWEKNYRSKKWEPTTKYYVTLPNREGIVIPITFLDELYTWLGENGLSYTEEEEQLSEPRDLNVKVTDGWVARGYQKEAIDYLTNVNLPRHGLNAQTGDGKTVMAIFTIVKLNMIPLIILPGQVLEQWPKRLMDQLQIDDDDIYLIQGCNSLAKLWKSDNKPKIFVASIATMRSYALKKEQYVDFPSYSDFVKEYGIGVKISDEAHMHFATNVLLDLCANIKHNIYLTATFKTGNSQLRRIFNKVYPEGMRYMPKDYDSYVHITEYGFMGNVPTGKCTTNRGYNQAMYEQHLLKYDFIYSDWADRVLFPIINSHYTQKNVPKHFKCVIFCRTVDFINRLVVHVQKYLPDRKVMRFVEQDPESVLDDAEVIISTFGSCGTGKDIRHLYTVINTVSFKAPTLTLQVIGRLRKLDGYDPEYVECFDINIPACLKHWHDRAIVYKQIGKTYQEYKIR